MYTATGTYSEKKTLLNFGVKANHLGNVLVTISDRKIPHESTTGIIDYYTADIMSAQDYYPFGQEMPGRNFSSNTYKFGFNGKLKDDEIAGVTGADYDYGARMYDARVCRFLSVDPITSQYPMLTPYQFASNSPISGIDLDGKEFDYYIYCLFKEKIEHPNQSDIKTAVNAGISAVGKPVSTVVSGPMLVATGITFPIVGNIVQGVSGNMYYPSFWVPYTLSSNLTIEAHPEMMGESLTPGQTNEVLGATVATALPPLFVEGSLVTNELKQEAVKIIAEKVVQNIPVNNTGNNSNTPPLTISTNTPAKATDAAAATTATTTSKKTSIPYKAAENKATDTKKDNLGFGQFAP